MALLALIGIAIPLKTSGLKGFSSQTTETTCFETRPLKWAIYARSNDLDGWLDKTDEFKRALWFFYRQYGGNYYEMYRVIQCESGWNEKAKNKNSTASGLAQFLNGTWKTYCNGDKNNPYEQLECMTRMMSEGKQNHWLCWKLLYN